MERYCTCRLFNRKPLIFFWLAVLIAFQPKQMIMAQASANAASAVILRLSVEDESGNPIAFRAQLFANGRRQVQTWERGRAEISVPPGEYTLLVTHGFDYDAVRADSLSLRSSVTDRHYRLRKRYDLASSGWHCGESHMHGQHGRTDKPQSFSDAARLAEANGLNYIQIAQWWTPDFAWTSLDTLKKMSAEASTSLVTVSWNMESPKSYMEPDDGGKSGNLHCYGHGCTLGLKERPFDKSFWFSGPNFDVIREIHRQKAVVMLAHPVRFWFNNGNFVSNMASEMAFDYITGNGYDGVDIFNDGEPVFFEHERVWWNLLNMGYKVACTAGSDGSVIDGEAGRYRTYTRINGPFSWDKIADGIRDGRCVASSGPMLLVAVEGKDPGSEFHADGKKHSCSVKAWSSPLPGETLVAIQLIRNGEIVQAWDLREKKVREYSLNFNLGDKDFAWYAIRVLSTCTDPGKLSAWPQPAELYEVAVASPVYFIPEGFKRPSPAQAAVNLRISDEKGQPLNALVSVVDNGNEIAREQTGPGGKLSLSIPATSRLLVTADGYLEYSVNLYTDSPVYDFCKNFNDFFTPGGFNDLRSILGNLSFDIKLKTKE